MSALEEMQRQIDRLARLVEQYGVGERVPIAARYETNAGQTLTTGAVTIIDFEDLIFDPRAAVTTGTAWKFTAPAGGYYQVSADVVMAQSTGWVDGEGLVMFVYVNDAAYCALDYTAHHGSGSNIYVGVSGSALVKLTAGQYLDIRVQQGSGGNLALHTDADHNWVSIVRV